MLTEHQLAVIKQTIPVLQAHGEALTDHMYQRMFREYPEVQAYFNPAHQAAGSQQRALARAVVAYAQHIDNPAVLADTIELIAQKHVSLTIRPEHYPIVGENLLAAIREVLGEAATDEVVDAWAAAYGALAGVFTGREQEIYDEQQQTYGWQGFKGFVITRREQVSANIVSLYLAAADGQPLATHRAGQYVSIRVQMPDGQRVMRNYSLSNAPGAACYRISVKREKAVDAKTPSGVFSNYLHDQLQVDDRVELTPPCGEFTLELPADANKTLVFIAGGVGITPILPMLHAALQGSPATRPIVFIQGTRHGSVHAFSDEIQALAARHANLQTHVRYSAPQPADQAAGRHDSEGRIDAGLLDRLVGMTDAAYYFCGPEPMLAQINDLLQQRSVPATDRHYEFFGPAGPLAA